MQKPKRWIPVGTILMLSYVVCGCSDNGSTLTSLSTDTGVDDTVDDTRTDTDSADTNADTQTGTDNADTDSADGADDTEDNHNGIDTELDNDDFEKIPVEHPEHCLVGYRGTATLPTDANNTTLDTCIITAEEMASTYGVIANDDRDDTTGIQAAIDHVKANCSGGFNNMSVIRLPSGIINTSGQIYVDANYLRIVGGGSNPGDAASTTVRFTPSATTRYDNIVDFDLGGMTDSGGGNGGWIWPGRGAFRIQTRDVDSRYTSAYHSAPENRRDFYEGSVNFHWRTGVELTANSMKGSQTIHVQTTAPFVVGQPVWVGAANSNHMYDRMGVLPQDRIRMHMRQQIFAVTAVNTTSGSIDIDRPLEFDLYINSTADGSAELSGSGSSNRSKIVPLTAVQGVGIENLYLEQTAPAGWTPDMVTTLFENVDHQGAMHGIVIKWSQNIYLRNVRTFMTGSHPIVTEMSRYVQLENNYLEGSWNKGKGGNGYVRLSKLWDSLIIGNTMRKLRHLTLQWSASGNIVTGNWLDSDINFHGGWERHNLVENNVVQTPFGHRECNPNCAGNDDIWYPVWWAAGEHAGGWAGASGPRNILYNNRFRKQLTENGSYDIWRPLGDGDGTVYQMGWDRNTPFGSEWEHLSINGNDIATWTRNQNVPFWETPNGGVNGECVATVDSLIDAEEVICNGIPVPPNWSFCRNRR